MAEKTPFTPMNKRKAGLFMSRGFSLQHSTSFILCMVLSITAGLSACGGNTISIIEPKLPPCKLKAPGVNVYLSTPIPAIPTIFQHAATATPLPSPLTPVPESDAAKQQKIIEARYAALRRLEYELKRWTDIKDIPLDNLGMAYAQITVTFLSPELVQAVYLNNLLKNNPGMADIYPKVTDALSQFGARDESVFFITATVLSHGDENIANHTLVLNPDEIKLINTEGLSVKPQHDDPNLHQAIGLSQSVFGYVSYPFAVQPDNLCIQILDPTYNTKIIIQASGITIDNVSIAGQTWTIPYTPLLNTGNTSYIPDFSYPAWVTFPLSTDPEELSPINKLPTDTNPSFWRDFARFVWGQVTLANY